MTQKPNTVVDVHTHVYLPRYVELMRERKTLPKIVQDAQGQDKLLILPDEDQEGGAGGRPVQSDYWNLDKKLEWMGENNIHCSVLSLANPWLDFMDGSEAAPYAKVLNDDMDDLCSKYGGNFYGFGVLPVTDGAASAAEIQRLKSKTWMRGAIIGTRTADGQGLDSPQLEPLWQAAAENDMTLFIHPHYGVGNEHYTSYGHSLMLALGFPFETSAAVSKIILSGVLERHPKLKLLIAHSGGTLPFLAGRIDSCVRSDPFVSQRAGLTKKPSEYLKQLYYDAVVYHKSGLNCVREFANQGHLLFGTDHPFSIADPNAYFESFDHLNATEQSNICLGNAIELLRLNTSNGHLVLPQSS